jgi:[acyl-carrier-protein] S-malonyltransferase
MGLELADRCPAAARLLDHASNALDLDVRLLLTRGGRALDRSEILQPVLTAVSLGAALALQAAGLEPDRVAGHSLGELAAWSAAGALTAEDAITLAIERGRRMAEAAATAPGAMLALSGSSEADVAWALARGRQAGALVLAAHNAPDEWILAGDEAALRLVETAATTVRLRVSGPWHSPAMAAAAASLRQAAMRVPLCPMRVPLVSSVSGELEDDCRRLPELLAMQLVTPVQWAQVMQALRPAVSHLVTCGPGKVLRSLARRNLGHAVQVLGTETPADLDCTRTALRISYGGSPPAIR